MKKLILLIMLLLIPSVLGFQQNFTNANTRGIIWKEGDAVGVYELSIELVKHIGKEPVTSSMYIGTGRNAEYITLENCKKLK